jgi:Acyl-coenzyme A:6-aminopenicillanic acid acyl-transferase
MVAAILVRASRLKCRFQEAGEGKVKPKQVEPSGKRVVDIWEGGSLTVYESAVGEMPVLHVRGTPEQMGRQYGALVGDLVHRNVERLVDVFSALEVPAELVEILLDRTWERLSAHVPSRFLKEIAAIGEGARTAGHDVGAGDVQRLVAATNFDLYRKEERLADLLGDAADPMLPRFQDVPPQTCTAFAAWGSRTVDGKLFGHRNLDWLAQTGMHDDRLITVYQPKDGRACVTVGYAGIVGALAGMNDRGIAFGEIGAFSVSEELDGCPWTLLMRQVLEEADGLDGAIERVKAAKHTIGMNFVVADGDPGRCGTDAFQPGAAAFETNHTCCEVFTDDDPKEHAAVWMDAEGNERPYGLPLKEAVMRADTAFAQSTRVLQAADNGPGEPANDGDPFSGRTYIEALKPMHDMIRAYETGDAYVYPVRETRAILAGEPRLIGAEEAATIAATVAHNSEKLVESDWNVMSVVYAPTDLDFWVAYESRDENGVWNNAPDSGYVHFNLRELLDAAP